MRTLCALLIVVFGCHPKKEPLEWYPRVSGWNNAKSACWDKENGGSDSSKIEDVDFCRQGMGALIKLGTKL